MARVKNDTCWLVSQSRVSRIMRCDEVNYAGDLRLIMRWMRNKFKIMRSIRSIMRFLLYVINSFSSVFRNFSDVHQKFYLNYARNLSSFIFYIGTFRDLHSITTLSPKLRI